MASSLQLGAIGQISLPVTRIDEAERFYRDVLGLPHLFTFGNLAFFDCDGTRLFCEAQGEGFEKHASVLYFSVPDIDAAFDQLQAKGVSFHGAPHMIHRHEDRTEEWMAFFEDPFGNVLSIMCQRKADPATP